MKSPIGLAAALMTTGLVFGSPESANAVVYCQYVDYPAHWVVRPGRRPRSASRRVRCRTRSGAAWHSDQPRRPVDRAGRR
jgi:hypothetical protein